MANSLNIEVICDNINNNPHCFHGPTLKFRKLGSEDEEYFACSACRDRKFCSFYAKSTVKCNQQSERAVLTRKKIVSKLNYKQYAEKIKALKRLKRQRRGFCQTCNVLFDALSDHSHSHCRKIIGLLKRQLLHPTEICIPNENDKVEAQYFFDKDTTNFVIDAVRSQNVERVLCIGTPRLHESLLRLNLSSLLLDIDPKYHNFYSRKRFIWYNMFNHFAFDNQRMRTLKTFLSDSGHFILLLDPPFGGRIEPIVETLKKIEKEYAESRSTNVPDKIKIIWFFPYFMERHITDSLPDFKMLDYHVNYENHDSFRAAGPRKRKYGSPVRIFTNIPLSQFDLSSVSGYKYCEPCGHWVSQNNWHCNLCKSCTSKNGMRYVHCKACRICVKPSYNHCDTCRRCCLKSHICGQFQPNTNCYHCNLPGHKRSQCPEALTNSKRKKTS